MKPQERFSRCMDVSDIYLEKPENRKTNPGITRVHFAPMCYSSNVPELVMGDKRNG